MGNKQNEEHRITSRQSNWYSRNIVFYVLPSYPKKLLSVRTYGGQTHSENISSVSSVES